MVTTISYARMYILSWLRDVKCSWFDTAHVHTTFDSKIASFTPTLSPTGSHLPKGGIRGRINTASNDDNSMIGWRDICWAASHPQRMLPGEVHNQPRLATWHRHYSLSLGGTLRSRIGHYHHHLHLWIRSAQLSLDKDTQKRHRSVANYSAEIGMCS